MENKLYFGFEIEGLYNSSLSHINVMKVGAYHNGIHITNNWKLEKDGSLRVMNYDFCKGIEFISGILNLGNYVKVIDEYINLLSNYGEYELNKVVDFNKSCGCHIHFSISGIKDNREFKRLLGYEGLWATRKMFFKLLDNNKIIPKSMKLGIRKHYFRKYSIKHNNHILRDEERRNSEWNISNYRDCGMEWRSFNMLGIKTWKQFREMIKIGVICLCYLYQIRMGNIPKVYKKGMKLNKNKLLAELQDKVNIREIDNNNKIEYCSFNNIKDNIRYEDVPVGNKGNWKRQRIIGLFSVRKKNRIVQNWNVEPKRVERELGLVVNLRTGTVSRGIRRLNGVEY